MGVAEGEVPLLCKVLVGPVAFANGTLLEAEMVGTAPVPNGALDVALATIGEEIEDSTRAGVVLATPVLRITDPEGPVPCKVEVALPAGNGTELDGVPLGSLPPMELVAFSIGREVDPVPNRIVEALFRGKEMEGNPKGAEVVAGPVSTGKLELADGVGVVPVFNSGEVLLELGR